MEEKVPACPECGIVFGRTNGCHGCNRKWEAARKRLAKSSLSIALAKIEKAQRAIEEAKRAISLVR